MKITPGNLVVITGGGSGIGRATARRLARQGAEVIVADIKQDRAAETVALIEKDGGTAYAYRLDVGDAAAFERFAALVRREHRVPDVVVNNAGFALAGSFLDQSAADWQRILDVNLMGVVHGSRLFGAQMVERGMGGHIVNIASMMAYTPSNQIPSYSVSKAAVLMATECLRIELAHHGIGVTAICPGHIASNIGRDAVMVGVAPEVVAARREVAAKLESRSPRSPDIAARAILRAIRRNWAIVPVTPEAWATYALSRLSPGMMRAFGRALASPALEMITDELLPLLVGRGQPQPVSEPSSNGAAAAKVTV